MLSRPRPRPIACAAATGHDEWRPPRGVAPPTSALGGTPAAEAAPDRGPGQTGFEPVTLFIGTEKGFTYRLTLMPSARASAQILIRNADAVPAAASVPVSGGEPHVGALVRLVRAVVLARVRVEPEPACCHRAGDVVGLHLGDVASELLERARDIALEARLPRNQGSPAGAVPCAAPGPAG